MWINPNHKVDHEYKRAVIFHELFEECERSVPGARLSHSLRNKLEKYSHEVRRDIVNRINLGCTPLFIACKRGQTEIVEYLITVCWANIEQKGLYELQEDRSFHVVTPLWCAAVSGKLSIIEVLLRHGADINAVSDTGSTPVRSACFMAHGEIVEQLVKHGADINMPNYNGGTCLINSLQSAALCNFLLKNKADVNARDIQNKTALHYAIQEHRIESTMLLLKRGANYNAKSVYGDDALQLACLEGATRIFDYLITTIEYPSEKLADAYELMGTTCLDQHLDAEKALLHWRTALDIRIKHRLIPKEPIVPPREGYRGEKEFESLEELENISADQDRLRTQSLLIAERILGPHHKDTVFRLMNRGSSYADMKRYQRCIDLWRRALEIKIEKHFFLDTDTCFYAQAVVRVMIDYHDESTNGDNQQQRFHDIASTFELMTNNIVEIRQLLTIKPVYKRQADVFDKMLKCISHLIFLMIENAITEETKKSVWKLIAELLKKNVKCVVLGDTILHLCLSKLNTVKSSYVLSEVPRVIFPKESVVKCLLECGADVNAINEKGYSPLHIVILTCNSSYWVVKLLLEHGAHPDQPYNASNDTPLDFIKQRQHTGINLLGYIPLKCLCARVIAKNKIPYKNKLPKVLEQWVVLHEPLKDMQQSRRWLSN